MDLTYTEDAEAGAAYLSWGPLGEIVSTVNHQQDKNLDFDVEGNIVGIEFLSLPPTIDIIELQHYAKLDVADAQMIQDVLLKTSG